MEKKIIIKIILVIILIVTVVFLITTFKKFFILQDMQTNANLYVSSENFHKRIITNEDENMPIVTDVYKKGEKKLVIVQNEEAKYKTSLYYDGIQCDEFYETAEGKKAKLNTNATLMEPLILNYIATENSWGSFLASIYTHIEEVTFNEKECYLITGNLNSAFSLTSSDEKEIYIEKETGLCVKIVYNNGKTEEMQYEFNHISDEIFVKPDVNQYEIIQ